MPHFDGLEYVRLDYSLSLQRLSFCISHSVIDSILSLKDLVLYKNPLPYNNWTLTVRTSFQDMLEY